MIDDKEIIKFLLQPEISNALDNENFDVIYREYKKITSYTYAFLSNFLLKERIVSDIYGILDNVSNVYTDMFDGRTDGYTELPSPLRLPNNITALDDGAFACYCEWLKDIRLPDSVAYIGLSAFQSSGLREIYIPKTVSYIGSCAFEDCYNLSDIYCEAKKEPANWSKTWNGHCSAQIHWGVDYDYKR